MTRYQDDFYDAINGEWEKTAVIPADKSRTGGFIDLDEEIEELMLTTTDKWLAGEDVPEDAILANFVKYHSMVRDFDKREADGIEPSPSYALRNTKNLESFADFTRKLAEFELAGETKTSFHLEYHQTLWMLEPMFSGLVLQELSCLIQPTMRKTILSVRNY